MKTRRCCDDGGVYKGDELMCIATARQSPKLGVRPDTIAFASVRRIERVGKGKRSSGNIRAPL
jgi:hypothetical protein